MILEGKNTQNDTDYKNEISSIQDFIEKFGSMSGSILYGAEITIMSSYYAFQVNGIQIKKMDIVDDVLMIRLANNRAAEFRILSDTSIKIEKSVDGIERVNEKWLMD